MCRSSARPRGDKKKRNKNRRRGTFTHKTPPGRARPSFPHFTATVCFVLPPPSYTHPKCVRLRGGGAAAGLRRLSPLTVAFCLFFKESPVCVHTHARNARSNPPAFPPLTRRPTWSCVSGPPNTSPIQTSILCFPSLPCPSCVCNFFACAFRRRSGWPCAPRERERACASPSACTAVRHRRRHKSRCSPVFALHCGSLTT